MNNYLVFTASHLAHTSTSMIKKAPEMHCQTCRLQIDLKHLKQSVIIFPTENNICKNPKKKNTRKW